MITSNIFQISQLKLSHDVLYPGYQRFLLACIGELCFVGHRPTGVRPKAKDTSGEDTSGEATAKKLFARVTF